MILNSSQMLFVASNATGYYKWLGVEGVRRGGIHAEISGG